MNWNTAVQHMLEGHSVQRKSQQYRKQIAEDIYETGEEPICLADAYTYDGKQVLVFQGTISKQLFYPRPCQIEATDWVIV